MSTEQPTLETVERGGTSFDRELGENLWFARALRGVSQERLAEALGVSPRKLEHWESGRRRIPAARLMQIAFALAIPDEAMWRVLLPSAPETKRLCGDWREQR